MTREASYLEVVRKGADFLLERFRDFDQGLFFYSMTPEGKILDQGKNSYGLAFVILALSHAGRVTGDDKYKKVALATWGEMKSHLRDETGFFKPKTDRGYAKVIGQNTQNPMMHWAELRGRADLWPAFDKSLAFVRNPFIDPEYGGWYSTYDPANRARGSGKGSVWQVGYHVCGFYTEALRLLRLAGAGVR